MMGPRVYEPTEWREMPPADRGNLLRAWRLLHDLLPADAADVVGVWPETWISWEEGGTVPNWRNAWALNRLVFSDYQKFTLTGLGYLVIVAEPTATARRTHARTLVRLAKVLDREAAHAASTKGES